MELPPGVVEFVLGTVASVVTRGLQLVANRWNWKPNRIQVNTGLMVVAIGLQGAIFGFPDAPLFEDPMGFAIALLDSGLAVLGAAAILYNTLLNKVLLPAKK
jgi:hypothetical protein